MRSIHKKTLKRLLSTVLAIAMVLSLMPATVFAAPVTDVQSLDLGYWNAEVTATKPDALATGATDSISLLIELTKKAPVGVPGTYSLVLTVDGTTYSVDVMYTVDGSGTNKMTSISTVSGVSLDATAQTITVTHTKNVTGPGTVTVPVSLQWNSTAPETDTLTYTIDRKADLTLTVPPSAVTVGEGFTVSTVSDIAEGYVKFTYGTEEKRVEVIPDENGKGIASATFTATGTSVAQTVTALQYAMTGVVNSDVKTATITVNAATVYHTVTFLENGPGVYQMPAAQTVKSGDKATEPAVKPGREGYTFGGWYKEAACTSVWTFGTDAVNADTILYAKWIKNATYSVTYSSGVTDVVTGMPDSVTGIAAGSSFVVSQSIPARAGYTFLGWATTSAATAPESAYAPGASITVTNNVALYAVWQQNTVQVTYPADVTGADVSKTTNTTVTENVTEGSTQTFTVTLTEGYDPATLTVTANGVALAPVLTNVATRVYTYSFVANVDTQILVSTPKLLKYTITLPTGDHFTAKFTEPSEVAGKGSYTFNYGATDAEFTVQLKDGYTGKVYIDGVAQTPEIAKNGTETYSLHATDGIKHVCDIRVETTKVRTFTVTYTIDGQTYTTRTVDKDTLVKSLADIAVPDKTGYTFDAWYSDTDLTTVLRSATGTVTGDMEVYGKWTPVQGTIAYELNGGSGSSITAQTKVYGVSLPLHATIPTRTGFTFKGWATVDGGAAVYQPGDMYSTEIGTSTVTLYAVWEQITFTVTLPSGTGYSISTEQSTTVKYGGSFTFTVKVDRDYVTTLPTVKANTATLPIGTAADSGDGGKTYTYTISNITADQVVSVTVKENKTYTVTFYTWKNDGMTTEVYQTQQVEDTYKATQPAAPVIEGYTFDNWYVWTDSDLDGTIDSGELAATAYDFSIAVIRDLALVGKMTKNTYQVTWPSTNTTGWTMAITAPTQSGGAAITASPFTVNHGDKVEFKVTVKEGYDASAMQVGVNGKLWAADSITASGNDTVYTYTIPAVTETTTITVVGVVRKTVTITYNANAGDDVRGMPEQQVVKYYLASDYDTITTQTPTRTGYNFLGWSTNSEATTAAYSNPAVTGTSNIANFATDTTLYAIWQAQTVTIGLAVSDTVDDTAANKQEYEGQPVTLTATLSPAVSTGSINFYKNGTLLISVPANGSSTYTATAVTSAYKLDGTLVEDSYQVEYKAEGDEGYGSADKTAPVKVTVLSTTITWELDGSNKVVDTDKLTIYIGEGTSGSTTDQMEANNVYTLKIPVVKDLNDKTLTADKDYIVEWIYKDDKGVEREYTDAATGDYAVISAEYSQYQFRAVVTPVKDATRSVYNKAAGYNENLELTNDDAPALYSQWTVAVAREQTETALAIEGAAAEAKQVAIDGEMVDIGTADTHWAQFEGDKLVLKASVTIKDETTPVSAGYVDFYRYNTDGTWTKLNADPVAVDKNTGIATFGDDYNEAVLVKAYVDGTGSNADEAKANVDKFFAVYLANATWETSPSTNVTYTAGAIDTVTAPAGDDVVYVKSTTIKTPVIDVKRGATVKGNTTYTTDLDNAGLTAGVDYTLTLRETGASTSVASNWSVVALDGRTVAAENYSIQWWTGNGSSDPAKVDLTEGTDAVYTAKAPVKDDYFYVELTAQNNMDKGEKSNKVIIDAKQDVNVSVVASDEIKSTAETDVYQLNMITLTATVTAKEDDAAEQPTDGLVGFYYQPYSGAKWVKIGESKALTTEDGKTFAEIETNVLPVDAAKNTKQTVKVLAVYEGNDTFNASHEVASDNSVSKKTTGTVEIEEVTVYSSVVYVNSTVENKANNTVGQDHTSGIYIYAEEDKVLANETNVNLKLSDVYTLDHNPTLALSKLAYGVDYTVQWQKLTNAASYASDYADEEVPWQPITSANGTICQIAVEDGAAYRAVITVKDTPIAKGSYTFVDQVIDGRQVYYSNILVAADAPATVTVNVNTDKTGAGFEGIVQGEKVTIHTFASGASGTTPISELTVTVTKNGAVEPTFKQVKTNVNGHVSFDWTADEPGYYTMKLTAKFTNGYSDKIITRELIVRDNDYGFNVTRNEFVYDGQVQGLELSVTDMGIEDPLAQKSVVVYYYDKDNKQVEPTQAGTYKAVIRLQESAYWTEKTENVTFTIKQREVSVVDLVAQAKVYDGTTNANIQEIILEDAVTDQTTTGLPTGTTGIINGDSVYAVGTAVTNSANVNEANSVTVTVTELLGDDAANYTLVNNTYTEAFNIQRSQVKGDIANSTYKYTGSNITVPADDIYLIDQAGNVLTPADYTVTYYYHNGDGVEKVTAMNKLGKYTVIARPDQTNYKGGASETVYVVSGTGVPGTLTTYTSALIDITNTVELFGAAGNTGIVASATNGATIKKIEYQNGTGWIETAPTAAGRYLVKVTASTGDTAYGIYTIVKANPALTLTAANQEYTSAQISGTPTGTFNGAAFPTGTYFTYAGGTIQGVAYEAPTEVGTYIVTAHVPETDNYTAHEISYQFKITPKALTITADSLQRRQYGAFPDMTASFDGLATGGVAVDTSLRDVQIQPELIFDAAYSNDAMDQVGNNYSITPVAALARNYDISYVNGNLSVTRDEPNPYLAIHGMIDNGNGGDIAYYGDVIQLYAYGSQSETGVINNSSVLTWSVTGPAEFVTGHDGLLKINGVGTVVVTLTRGVGAQKISTTLTITALKQEIKIIVPNEDVVYSAESQSYTKSNISAVNGKLETITDPVTSKVGFTNDSRTNVGSQIVEATVSSSTKFYQSETYGGLFTINDKEVTVKPNEASVVYGEALSTLTYTETGTVGGVKALTNGKAVSIRDSYVNLDVLDGYEILVAGTENMNYNVKYITDQDAPDAQVTAKPLTVSTGTLNNNVGMTSGSLNPNGKFPVNGAEVASTAALGDANVRMYGEPNWVMDYALATLVDGDSLADLALDPLADNLVKFNYNIGAAANITYLTRTSTTPTYIGSLTAYPVDTDDSMIAFGNYTEDYTTAKGKQNIYQRPVTLKLANGTDKLDVLFSDVNSLTVDQRTAYLRNLIVANLNVLKYTEAGQEVGGLATLLKHTANDLDYELTYTYDASGFDVTIKAINNYWSEDYTIHVNVVKEKYRVVYNSFTATSATVTLYHVNLDTGAETAEFLPSGNLMCKIFICTADDSYLGETPVVNVAMQRTSTPGVYTVTYPRLVGSYHMFAIAEGGVGYTIVNGIE